jgi:hypothetical protein
MTDSEIAYNKVKALERIVEACESKSDVNELLRILPELGMYQRLPDEITVKR